MAHRAIASSLQCSPQVGKFGGEGPVAINTATAHPHLPNSPNPSPMHLIGAGLHPLPLQGQATSSSPLLCLDFGWTAAPYPCRAGLGPGHGLPSPLTGQAMPLFLQSWVKFPSSAGLDCGHIAPFSPPCLPWALDWDYQPDPAHRQTGHFPSSPWGERLSTSIVRHLATVAISAV